MPLETKILTDRDKLKAMNKHRFQRAILLTGFIGLLFVGGYGFWLFQAQGHQYALNRQLIAALVKRDTSQALLLVNAGADPNTSYDPPPAPSLKHLWNHLLHHSALPAPENNTPRGFQIACGRPWPDPDSLPHSTFPEAPRLVEAMLAHHANISAKDSEGRTALRWAVVSDHRQTVRVLVEHGANANAVESGGWTPLMAACYAGSPDSVRLLLEHGGDMDAQDNNGSSALHWAVLCEDSPKKNKVTEIVRQLLAYGAKPTVRDLYGDSAITLAQKHHPDIVTLLKQAGAKK